MDYPVWTLVDADASPLNTMVTEVSVPESSTARPPLSVIVPVLNDPAGIRRTLQSLTTQSYPDGRFEILVVDNGSTDDSREIIKSFVSRYPDVVQLLVEDERMSSYAARNAGIEQATASILVFIDADMTVSGTHLEEVAAVMNEGPVYMGCNVKVVVERETLPARYNQLFSLDVKRNMEIFDFASTAALVVRRKAIDEVGEFDPRMISSGDAVFGQQITEAGFEMAYCPEITLCHPARETVQELVQRDWRIGIGLAQWERLHPDLFEAPPAHDFREFLPPSIEEYRDRLSTALSHSSRMTGVTRTEWLTFYFLYTLQKFVRAQGRLAGLYITNPNLTTMATAV